MNLLDRIKGRPADSRQPDSVPPVPLEELVAQDNPMERTVRLEPSAAVGTPPTQPADSSFLSESAASQLASETGPDAAVAVAGLPLIGHLPVARQQRVLSALFALGLVGLIAVALLVIVATNRGAAQVDASGRAQTHSQRLAKSVSQALIGNTTAFPEVRESADILARNVRTLADGSGDAPALGADLQALVAPLLPMVERAERNARIVADQQPTLTGVGEALREINRQLTDLHESTEAVLAAKLRQGASGNELAAVGHLVTLTQRIGRNANEVLTMEGVSPEAVFLLGKDLNTFRELLEGLDAGSVELRLPGTRDPATRELLAALAGQYEQTRAQGRTILTNLQGLIAAREAHGVIVADSEPLRLGLDTLQQQLARSGGFGAGHAAAGVASLLLLLAGAGGLLRLFIVDQSARARVAEAQRQEAERQEQEAKRVNNANQAAILRLMNELQTVAEGDLTQQATVTEDITGAIADSVNYTVEELRSLVSQVQDTVQRVTGTTQQVEQTSTELLAASTEQLREIRETGESVLQMAGRINQVSSQAQQTADVAQKSLQAAETGLQAVNDTIGGMNAIREQIQETSKRIKRLGESSQEIGEITELIGDITEQTNVLALNAAIQAASAGEAGRGFSVVAEEVQRLAERSGDATRQIAAIVRTIQTDTQDAVAAMERSTQGVVEGARLSDAAGAALADIDRVTRELSALIVQISDQASREAAEANVVAESIQHIFAVTEQTGDGTRSTAQMVRELSRTAEELRQSVARFKVS